MAHKVFGIVITVVLLTALAGCTTQPAPTPTPEPTEIAPVGGTDTIVLTDIDADDPIGKIEEFQPLADYLAANLAEHGISVGEVRIAPDLETVIGWMESGEVDLYYDSPYPAMRVIDATGAQPILRGWRGGEPVYHSVFFARADSGLAALEDIVGHVIAYDDRASTSGFMLPTAYLIENGLNPVEVPSPDAAVAGDQVGYVFSQDDQNTIEWVIEGVVDVGVVDNLTYMGDIPEETRAELVILAETEEVPRRVLVARPDLEPELVEAIKSLFVEMESTPEGQALLETLKTKRFDEFPEGADAFLDRMREIYALVEGQ